MSANATYDCQRCGACCVNSDENRAEGFAAYVPVARRDAILRDVTLAARFVVYDAERRAHMRLVGPEQRCAALTGALGRRVRCDVHAVRPAPCRRVNPGDPRCRAARRERGLE